MTVTIVSGIINAPPETVWAALRDFSAPSRWVRNILSSDVEKGHAVDQVGAVRRLVFDSGNELRERLTALSDHDRYFRYSMLTTDGMPIRDYNGRVQVLPVTDSDHTLVHWHGSFTVAEGVPEQVHGWVRGIYQNDIEDMRIYFSMR